MAESSCLLASVFKFGLLLMDPCSENIAASGQSLIQLIRIHAIVLSLSLLVLSHRLTLDAEDIVAWEPYAKDDVLSHACLSAKWENNDAIDQAVTTAIGGDPKVCHIPSKDLAWRCILADSCSHPATVSGSHVIIARL